MGLACAGRFLYALPMLVFGVFHFVNADKMTGYIPAYLGMPAFWVYLTGAALVAAALAIMVGKWAQLAATLLGVMLLGFVLLIHLPGVLNPETMMMAMPALLKDVALAGAAFLLAGSAEAGCCKK